MFSIIGLFTPRTINNNRMKKRRFLAIYESMLTRANHSGYLVGDIVEFTPDALKHDFLKSQTNEAKKVISDLATCKGTLRVTNVVSKYPAVMGAGNVDDFGGEFNIEVSEDNGGGRLGNSAIVHAAMLKKLDPTPNLEPVPDKNKRKDRINIDPVEVKDEAEEVPFYSPIRTRISDLGNQKMSKGDRVLNNTNVTIPSSPAVGHKDPATYTAAYLPKA